MEIRVSDTQWALVKKYLPVPAGSRDGRGRKPRGSREIFEALLWMAIVGARWKDLLESYPPYQTVYDRYRWWLDLGALEKALKALCKTLKNTGKIDLSEGSVDGMFVRARRGGEKVGKTKCGKGSKLMVMADANGMPIGIDLFSATPHESQLLIPLMEEGAVCEGKPHFILGDGAYDSEELHDDVFSQYGSTLVARHKKNRVSEPYQDGRHLRRLKRRWKIERTNSWIQNYRKCLIRWEKLAKVYFGWVKIACLLMYINYILN